MAKINVKFNNKDYQIEESAFAAASEKVVTHLSGEMKGTGATVKFGGIAYDVDSTKLSLSAAVLAAYLETIVGSGVKIVIGGVEYGVDAAKVAGAVTEVETTLAGMGGSEEPDVPVEPDVPELPASEGLEYTSNGDGTCYVSSFGTCTDNDVVIPSVSPEGEIVTGIGEVFGSRPDLASVVIPDTITRIEDCAFDGCFLLPSIDLPSGITYIGFFAFNSCDSLKSINFDGTKAQWEAIEKDDAWYSSYDGSSTTIYCTDGNIVVEGQ